MGHNGYWISGTSIKYDTGMGTWAKIEYPCNLKTQCVHKECTQECWCYSGDESDVKCKESKKEITDLELEYPQTVAQSYKVLENNS